LEALDACRLTASTVFAVWLSVVDDDSSWLAAAETRLMIWPTSLSNWSARRSMSDLRRSACCCSVSDCCWRNRLVSIMASRNTSTVRAISPISSARSPWTTGASSSPLLSEAIRCFSPDSGLTTLRVIAQATAIEISISTAMTAEAVLTIDQKVASTSER
jgi:hypothetical protein